MNILDPQGPVAAANKIILIDSIGIMLAIVLPTIVAIFGFAFWFRQSNPRAFYWPDWEHSGRLELVVWSIPALTVILLGGVAWIGSHELDPARPIPGTGPGVTIQVVSLDWKWLFIYPDQRVASLNSVTVPVGSPLHLQLTSASVMNVFFIPQLGSMIYTMNGMVTRLELRADEVGTIQGLSAHFSGDGFPAMLFDVHIVPLTEFDDWVRRTARGGEALDRAAYDRLVQQSIPKDKPAYRLDYPQLFNDITTLQIPPGPGPELTTNLARPTSSGAVDAR